ncbi:MAG: DUF1294 domain-containing protein [Streptococcus sp.]|nr:DUF1294 domain-containing protein [Streptococcus sp.]
MKWIITGICLLWNFIVFLLYGLDKRKAIKHQYRIPEKTLLLSALLCAGIGAFFGGRIFHHKTKKWYFWLIWICGMVLEILFIYYIWRS